MNKLFEVREFDVITGNKDFADDNRFRYIDSECFNGFMEFAEHYSQNSETTDVLKFMNVSYKRSVGNVISVKNYVGLIQTKNGDQLHILPKIYLKNDLDAENARTKSIFIKMLRSMKNFPGKVFDVANIKIDKMNIYEIFINMYLNEVRGLVKKGIKSDYINLEDNLKFYKGKLLINKQIKYNIAHRERFFITYDDYNCNRSENRLIKSILLKLEKLTTSANNLKEIHQLLNAFELVKPSLNYTLDFSQIKNDRSSRDYILLMQWSKVFLFNKSFSTFSGKNETKSILFPMETVFESYVAKHIKKVLEPAGWEIHIQDKENYLFDEPRKQFALRPDIVCKRGNRTIIVDTKWKNLIFNERKNYGISQSDMYQMYAYSKKYNTPEVWLLYPLNIEMEGARQIIFKSKDNTNVSLHFVDLENTRDTFEEFRDKIEVTTSL